LLSGLGSARIDRVLNNETATWDSGDDTYVVAWWDNSAIHFAKVRQL